MPYKTPSEQEENRLHSQLVVTIQLAKDQALQMVNLERRLMQANDIAKISHERQLLLEQQLRDLMLASKKYQRSMQGQLNVYSKQAIQQNSDQQAYTI